jgi:hypothetical protein
MPGSPGTQPLARDLFEDIDSLIDRCGLDMFVGLATHA